MIEFVSGDNALTFVLGAAASAAVFIRSAPATIKTIRRPFAKTELVVEHLVAGIVGPPGSPFGPTSLIPGAIAVPPHIRVANEGLEMYSIKDIVYITPQIVISDLQGEWVESGSIDVRNDFKFKGAIGAQSSKLTSPYVEFHMHLANRSRHSDSCVTITQARIVIDDARPLYLGDRQVLVIVNDLTDGRGGGGGYSLETVRASAILNNQGVYKVDPQGPDHGDANLIKGQGFGLNVGDVRLFDLRLRFATSGRFEFHLELKGTDERGRPITRQFEPIRAAVYAATPEDIAGTSSKFVSIRDYRIFDAEV